MLVPGFGLRVLVAGLMVLGAGVASGQDYPSKPVRIVSGGAGGSADFIARLAASELSGAMGQQFIVDNRGGIMSIPAQIVAKSAPDGYTLLVYTSAPWTLPFMQKTPYDVARDFTIITMLASAPNILVVNTALPVNSIKDLIALAKSKPGSLNYAASGIGSSSHLAAEMFKIMAGIDMMRVPYEGNGQALIDLIGGQVQLMFSTAAAVAPHVKSGRLRALAVTGAQSSALAPGLPTIASAGLRDFQIEAIACFFAPVKTPASVVRRLNQEIVRAFGKADVKEKLFIAGNEVVGSTLEESAARMKSDMERMGSVVKAAGIRAD